MGVKFDWTGGDGLYGHNTELTRGLDGENLFYVLDVHKAQLIYLAVPSFSMPPKKGAPGANPIKKKADKPTIGIDGYFQNLNESQWDRAKIRKTAKGRKYVWAHTEAVWHWDGKEERARSRTLAITRTEEKGPKVKFSFSKGGMFDNQGTISNLHGQMSIRHKNRQPYTDRYHKNKNRS